MRFKPLIGKMFYAIWIPTILLLAVTTALSALAPVSLFITISVDIFTLYFLFSSLVAYVELREDIIYAKVGFIMKVEIPYKKIRGIERSHKFYSDSMLSIKNSLDHVNIKYNSFDLLSVSVVDNEAFVSELEKRVKKSFKE